MNDLKQAYGLGVKDRRNGSFVRNLRTFTTEAMRYYSQGWLDASQEEKTITTTSYRELSV